MKIKQLHKSIKQSENAVECITTNCPIRDGIDNLMDINSIIDGKKYKTKGYKCSGCRE